MSRAVMQQALEALVAAYQGKDKTGQVTCAITALKQALAEPETEVETYKRLYELRGKALDRPCSNCGYQPERIYPMAVAELEQPVAWVFRYSDGSFDQPSLTEHSSGMIPLYTAPTPRKPEQKVWCACGDSIQPDSGAKCGNCVAGDSAEPEQEQPVGQLQEEAYGRGQVLWFKKPADQSMLYTAPTPRKPLTDEEIALISGECAASAHRHDDFSFARSVIAAYQRKNGIGEQT